MPKNEHDERLEEDTGLDVFGNIISAEGIQMDHVKVETIQKFPRPRNVSKLRRFLGMVKYREGICVSADQTIPLRVLLKKEVQ